MGTAHKAGVEPVRQWNIIDEPAAPGEQRRVFEACYARAKVFRTHQTSIRLEWRQGKAMR
jgi:hypothetical protein